MAKSATKVKLSAPDVPAPQSIDQVNDGIARIGECQRDRARIEAEMNDKLSAIKMEYELLAEPYKDEIQLIAKGVQIYCDAHRLELTNDGKVKYARLPAGEVNWRLSNPAVKLKKGLSVETIIDLLKQFGLQKFVRTVEEVDKQAILAAPEEIERLKEISIEQKESFAIIPFETKLEAIA